MYRITPLDDHLPSQYEMLFGRRPKSFLPGSDRMYKSRHLRNYQHVEHNTKRQEDQAKFYKASLNSRPFDPGENTYIYNKISREWEPGTVVKQAIDLTVSHEHTQCARTIKNTCEPESISSQEASKSKHTTSRANR